VVLRVPHRPPVHFSCAAIFGSDRPSSSLSGTSLRCRLLAQARGGESPCLSPGRDLPC
jgi:hypothetical protein